MLKFFTKEKDIKFGNKIESGPLTMKAMEKIIRERKRKSVVELSRGYDLIKKYPKTISFLGSARFDENNKYYQSARSIAAKIVNELSYAVVTGGGPGIMEAANRGAYEAGGMSLGITIKLPQEQSTNKYVQQYAEFEYFFDRKALLFFSAEAYIYFPGGFGTLDEFFELITLIQTKKIKSRPVILVGSEFWNPLLNLIHEKLLDEYSTISEEDQSIYQVVDSEDEVIKIIRNSPTHNE